MKSTWLFSAALLVTALAIACSSPTGGSSDSSTETSTVGAGGISATSPSAVTVTLTLGSSTVAVGNPITATASASASVDSYAWYLDGPIIAGQTTASFSGGSSLASGPHTLMVVVRKDGIAYSASAAVQVQ